MAETLGERCKLETPEQIEVCPVQSRPVSFRLPPSSFRPHFPIRVGGWKGLIDRYPTRVSRSSPLCGLMLCKRREKAAVTRFEEAVIQGGPIVLPGAQALLSQIDARSSPSARGWTIVTSGTSPISLKQYATKPFKTNSCIQPRTSSSRKHSHAQACCSPPRAT